MIKDKNNLLQLIYKYTIGIVILCLPLFIATVVLLQPTCLNPNAPLSYITGLKYLFSINEVNIRNDLYFCFAIAWLMCIFVNLMTKINTRYANTLKIIWYAIIILLFITRRFLYWTFNLDINASTLSILMETNGTESFGFLKSFIFTWQGMKFFIKFCFIIFAVIASEWLWNRFKELVIKKKIVKISTSLLLIVFLPFIVLTLYSFTENLSTSGNTIFAITEAVKDIKAKGKESTAFYKTIKRIDNQRNVAQCKEDSIDVVFIIGESFNRNHTSIYGYTSLPTTPHMQKEFDDGRLIAFSDVISPFNYTTPSIKNMLSLNNLAKKEEWHNNIFWPQLFHKAGYKVSVFDNQRTFDKTNNGSFYEMYQPLVKSLCYDYVSDDIWWYDPEVAQTIKEKLSEEKGNRTFYVVHLDGQHFPFADRTPNREKKFTAADIKKRDSYLTQDMKQAIADYDNAILLNDKTLGEIFKIYKQRKAIIVFLSDHGEEIYDYRPKAMRPPMNTHMKKQYALHLHSIPVFVWISEQYKSSYPKIVNLILQAKNKPYSHDIIGNMMITLGHISSPYYRAEDDILNPQFKHGKRLMMELNPPLDYDSIIHTK